MKQLHDIKNLLANLMGSKMNDCVFGVEEGKGIVAEYLGIQLRSALQPIVTKTGKIIGYEGLLRAETARGRFLSPQQIFALGLSMGDVTSLDRICRCLHLLNFINDKLKGNLFLNVHPSLHDEDVEHGFIFNRVLKHFGQEPNRIVLEILESAVSNEKLLVSSVRNFRRHGFKIAIDDFGCEHSNLDRLWRIIPDFVKLDSGILQEANSNSLVLTALPHIVKTFQALKMKVVVEGIENSDHHTWAFESGADFGQGYHISHPILAGQQTHTVEFE